MKLFELKITHEGITIRREAEERLTRDQKFYIIITLIVCAAAIAFFYVLFVLALKS